MEGRVLSHLRSPKVLWLCYLSFQGDVWSSQCILTRPWVSSSTTRMEFALLDTTENHHCSYLAHKATTKAFQCFILNFNFGHFIFKVVSSSLSIFNPPTPYGWEYLGVWYLPSFLSTLLMLLADAPAFLSSFVQNPNTLDSKFCFKCPSDSKSCPHRNPPAQVSHLQTPQKSIQPNITDQQSSINLFPWSNQCLLITELTFPSLPY